MDFNSVTFSSLLFVFGSFFFQDAAATCVLETENEPGQQILNCGLRWSGFFRIKNLGGVKAFISLGLSQGDEIGFPQSTTSLDFAELMMRNKLKAAAAAKSNAMRAPKATNDLQTGTLLTKGEAKTSKNNVHTVNSSRLGVQNTRNTVDSPLKNIFPFPSKYPASVAIHYSQLNMSPSSNVTLPQRLTYTGELQPMNAPFLGGVVTQKFQKLTAYNSKKAEVANPTSVLSAHQMKSDDTMMGHSIKGLVQVPNRSIDAITASIDKRAQQLLIQQQQTPTSLLTTRTATPVTLPPVNSKRYPLLPVSKVLNAPKEYYPVGYVKKFNDNFASRFGVQETSFNCRNQKHIPGLYANGDLGCMVFHVCALTNDGVVMKSFLCPEWTVFDQTILKCNWSFYADCKSSAKRYGSNKPISRS